jgi:hypothetical protein
MGVPMAASVALHMPRLAGLRQSAAARPRSEHECRKILHLTLARDGAGAIFLHSLIFGALAQSLQKRT